MVSRKRSLQLRVLLLFLEPAPQRRCSDALLSLPAHLNGQSHKWLISLECSLSEPAQPCALVLCYSINVYPSPATRQDEHSGGPVPAAAPGAVLE